MVRVSGVEHRDGCELRLSFSDGSIGDSPQSQLKQGRCRCQHEQSTRSWSPRWPQWVEELTSAVLEHGAAAFIYVLPPGDSISDTTLDLWAHEVVPAVREAIAKR